MQTATMVVDRVARYIRRLRRFFHGRVLGAQFSSHLMRSTDVMRLRSLTSEAGGGSGFRSSASANVPCSTKDLAILGVLFILI